ncbi:MAG: pyridoxal-dependent decarboxylase [Rikenellaceae bacterium]
MNRSNTSQTSHITWFMGPKAEYQETWEKFIIYILRDHIHWRKNYYPSDGAIITRSSMRENEPWIDAMSDELDKILADFKVNNPVFSPRYLAHMISEQSLPSVLGYFAGLLYNANNIDSESSPVAVPMELETGRMLSEMVGYDPDRTWAHITSGGTVANIEALWVARTIKFIPFMVKEFCAKNSLNFCITTPNGELLLIEDCETKTLLALTSNEAIHMNRNLIKYMVEEHGYSAEKAHSMIAKHIEKSEFNIIKQGLYKVLRRLDVEPVIFVSSSGHYSIKKAANILGYGEAAVRTIDVDASFRINVDKLESAILSLDDNQYVAAVVNISGTTEEGAIDPLHRIVELRDRLSKEHNLSFWIHTDSAWGGYVRTLFCGYEIPKDLSLEKRAALYRDKINEQSIHTSEEQLWVNDPEVYLSLMSYPESDSITIDPHKQGYIPYSAGVILFRDSVVTEHIKQDAHYVFNEKVNVDYNQAPIIKNVGSYILEGSKSSAAAASCYLAHKSIPLTLDGHGKIIKSTLQSTITLHRLMTQHIYNFDDYTQKAESKYRLDGVEPSGRHFTIIPLHKADSNLLCYVIRPVILNEEDNSWSIDESISLEESNALCDRVYQRMTKNSTEKLRSNSAYDYFVTKSKFFDDVYSYEALESTFKILMISKEEYHEQGLFVFRTTVMNPFYHMAMENSSRDFLDEFIMSLHANTEAEIRKIK